MLVEIDEETIDKIVKERLKNDIENVQKSIQRIERTGVCENMWSFDYDEDLKQYKILLESLKNVYNWY